MTASFERISNRTRGTGYKVEVPEVGDRFTVRFLAPYGSITEWYRNAHAVSWSGFGVLVEANNGTVEDLLDAATWAARPVAVSELPHGQPATYGLSHRPIACRGGRPG